MQRIQKIVRVLFCAAVVSVLLSSCNNPTPTPQPAPSPAPAPTPSPAPAPSPAPTPSPAPIGGVFNKDEVYIPPIGSGSSGSSAPIISGGGSSSGGGTGGGSAPAITVTLASVVGGTSVTDSGITYKDFTSATILKAYPGASVAAIWTAIEAAIGTSNLGDYRIFAANNPTGSATAANAVSQANLTTLVGSATSKTIYVAKKQAAATVTKSITIKDVTSAVGRYNPTNTSPFNGAGVTVTASVASGAAAGAIQTALKNAVAADPTVSALTTATQVYKLFTSGNAAVQDSDYTDGATIHIGVRPKNDNVVFKIAPGTPGGSSDYTAPTTGSTSNDLAASFIAEHVTTSAATDFTATGGDVAAKIKADLATLAGTAAGDGSAITIGGSSATAGQFNYFKEAACTTLLDFTGTTSDNELTDGVTIYIAKKS